MSVRVMSEVWRRYPGGGGELLTALALADHAHDDGTSIRPSVKHLAEKTRQSRRTVQYQLRRMQARDWLQLVEHGVGGRSHAAVYQINPDWIKGADIARFVKGATDDNKGRNSEQERAQSETKKGATAIAPQPSENHQRTIKEPCTHSDACDRLLAEIRERYPKRAGGQRWADAKRHLRARLKEGHDPAAILEGVDRYRHFCTVTGKSGTETVQQAATFLGRNLGFLEDWTAPSNSNGGFNGQNRKLSAAERVRVATERDRQARGDAYAE